MEENTDSSRNGIDTCVDKNIVYTYKHHRVRDTWHGMMLYNINDTFIGKCLDEYGEWCVGELKETIKYCNGTVLDIGANIGTHALEYARHAKHVFAFEPQPILFNMLCANIALNCLENIWTSRTAAGNYTGIVSMPRIDYTETGNFGGWHVGDGADTCYIRMVDEFEFKNVSLIKVDVEGMEQEVLEGALSTIKRYKPILYIENDRPEKQDVLCAFVESLGYKWKWHCVPLFRENNYRQSKENLFEGIGGINMLCLPKERT